MSKLLGIVGSRSNPSNTRTAVDVALKAAAEEFDIETDIIHFADFEIEPADGRKLDEYTGDTAKAIDLIINSDSFIIGTPVYRGSYSGLLKNLLDIIPRGKWQSPEAPLENRPVGLIATGATDHHFLSISHELGPIVNFFGSYPVGSGVYLNHEQFDNYEVIDEDVHNRLEILGKATVDLANAIDDSTFLSKLGPQF